MASVATPSWADLAARMAELRMRFEESTEAVRVNTGDSMLRIADAKQANEARHAEQKKIKQEYERGA